jgi:hypothetical protein
VTFKPLLMLVTVLYGKSLEGESEKNRHFCVAAGSGPALAATNSGTLG